MLVLVIFCGLCGSVAALTGAGFWMTKSGRVPRDPRKALIFAMAFVLMTVVFSAAAFAAEVPEISGGSSGAGGSGGSGLALIGAALSTGLACIGAGIGVAFVGAAALGVVGEKPALFGRTLIYMGLAEGIAIYGIVVSILILFRA